MKNTIARRVQWLFPVEREVYRTFGALRLGAVPVPDCVRCGSPIRQMGDVGFQVRDRGSKWRNVEAGYIHRRCVPTPDFQGAGIPARRVRR